MTTQKHLILAEILVNLLENRFKLFNHRFGIDPIIGFIPVIGDLIPYLLSFYFIYIGTRANIPTKVLLKMIFYSTSDFVFGTIPVVGDYIDFIYKGNLRSFNVLKTYINDKSNATEVSVN